jgi:mono/diheme cytochrome c family protein
MRLWTALGVPFVLAAAAAGLAALDRVPGLEPAVAAPPPVVLPAATRAALPLTPELAEKERRSCVTCHTALGRPELNAAGNYYKEHRSFEGYTGELPARVPENAPPPAPARPREQPAPAPAPRN